MPAIVREHEVPAHVRAAAAMDPADYVDVFTIDSGHATDRSPDEWARTAIERVAGLGGQVLWRLGLGLRLTPSDDAVGGWTVGDRGARWIRLEAASWMLTAHLVVHVDEGRVSVGTFVRYERSVARLIWPLASIIHRAAMPGLLRGTVTTLSNWGER